MILVTGAAGKTGRAIVRALVAREQIVRALVHRNEQAQLVESLGAQEAVVGDMRDQGTFKRAASGVRAVYHICPNVNPDEIQIGKAAIAAARDARVEQFVFHSVLHPQTTAMSHHWNKLRVEEALFESGVPYTILQPASYMQNVLAGWQAIVERGAYPVPYSVGSRLSMVDLQDVAQAAAVVLTERDHLGATYELAGPEVLTQTQVAEILSRQLNRPVRAEQVTIEAWTRQAQASGIGAYQIETLVNMFRYYDLYGLCGNPRVLGNLIGHVPTKFEAFVERIVREGVDH
jgi:NAD(P)H dehydrogenase (quinone)